MILSCISVIGCATFEWKNVKKGKDNMATDEAAAEAEQQKTGATSKGGKVVV